MNNTKLSTFYDGNGSAGRPEEVYSAPDFTEANGRKDNQSMMGISDKTHAKFKQQLNLYSNVDESFLDKKPKDPYKYMDKKKQKIEINPGVPYISSSHDAVFEIRNKENAKNIGRQTNEYIQELEEKEAFDSEDSEDNQGQLAIKPVH
jgi:hypothetical protein